MSREEEIIKQALSFALKMRKVEKNDIQKKIQGREGN